MTDYSAQLARILAYVGLPACEEPMREATDGPYITWVIGKQIDHYASGKVYLSQQTAEVMLWCPPDAEWPELARMTLHFLCMSGMSCDFRGVAYDPQVDRHCARVAVLFKGEMPNE